MSLLLIDLAVCNLDFSSSQILLGLDDTVDLHVVLRLLRPQRLFESSMLPEFTSSILLGLNIRQTFLLVFSTAEERRSVTEDSSLPEKASLDSDM